jgi:hypothetical protein
MQAMKTAQTEPLTEMSWMSPLLWASWAPERVAAGT